MRKLSLSLLFLIVAVLTISAAERSVAKMRQAALRSLNSTKAECVLNKKTLEVYTDGRRFSIVSRDDRFPAVLAYGNGNFDVNKIPSNVKWWLEHTQRCMELAIEGKASVRAPKSYTPVAPLMTTKWGQGYPYNDMCPRISGDERDQDSPHAPTGCVATAMAQILNYQQYPSEVRFNGACYLGDELYEEREIQSTYSWPFLIAYGSYLPDGYTSYEDTKSQSYSVIQGKRIATLLRDCGYAVEMEYTEYGSGASTPDAGNAFVNKFNYPEQSVKFYYNWYYTAEEWMDILYAEFVNGCPVLYSGTDAQSGGHAFVLHGMDVDGLVYVNWGWDGLYDGYYTVGMLTLDDCNFSEVEEDMITGIRPTALSTDAVMSVFATDEPYQFEYDNETKALSLILKQGIYNLNCQDFKGRWCLVVENVNDSEDILFSDLIDEGTIVEYWSGYGAQTVSFDATFGKGTYHIYMATLDEGETVWQYVRTVGGAIYYDLTVDANGKVTIADKPTFTTGGASPTAIRSIRQQTNDNSVRYYNLQGQEVNGSFKGLLIHKQGNEMKKVVVK